MKVKEKKVELIELFYDLIYDLRIPDRSTDCCLREFCDAAYEI